MYTTLAPLSNQSGGSREFDFGLFCFHWECQTFLQQQQQKQTNKQKTWKNVIDSCVIMKRNLGVPFPHPLYIFECILSYKRK